MIYIEIRITELLMTFFDFATLRSVMLNPSF